ncbi:hypothetical protein GY14_00975 [Delftia tsuruhatensis]|nr:hypothetical protein GY14_00975 [Delftia tsuruhatensis]
MPAQPGVALRCGQGGQLPHLGIETLPALDCLVAGLGLGRSLGLCLGLGLVPQRGEGRHPVVIGGQRAEAGVVGIGHPLVQPGLVAFVELALRVGRQQGCIGAAPLRTQRSVVAAQLLVDLRLGLLHGGAALLRVLVQLLQRLARAPGQCPPLRTPQLA